jgi:hypothetical protein
LAFIYFHITYKVHDSVNWEKYYLYLLAPRAISSYTTHLILWHYQKASL